jgi:phosphatidylglycerophosphate synthase
VSAANAVTSLRLLIAPALVLAIAEDAALVATLLFFLAVATDVADGHLARRSGRTSERGALFDHAVDAIFVTAGTAALARAGVLPAALPPAIAIAFLQYAFDSRILASRGRRPSRLGRWNGIAYYVAVAVPLVRDALGLAWPGPELVRAGGWLLVATTAASVAERARLLIGGRARAA